LETWRKKRFVGIPLGVFVERDEAEETWTGRNNVCYLIGLSVGLDGCFCGVVCAC